MSSGDKDPGKKRSPHTVFISYCHEDYKNADLLRTLCNESGLQTYLDREELSAGELWDTRLHKELRDCDIFLVLLSQAALRSGKTRDREWQAICERSWESPKTQLVPICLDEANLPAFLSRRSAVDGRNLEALRVLLNELAHNGQIDDSKSGKGTRDDSVDRFQERLKALISSLSDRMGKSEDGGDK